VKPSSQQQLFELRMLMVKHNLSPVNILGLLTKMEIERSQGDNAGGNDPGLKCGARYARP
jgi:hypothetical protein